MVLDLQIYTFVIEMSISFKMLYNIFLQKYFAVIDWENAAVSDFSDLPTWQHLDVASACIEVVAERDAVLQVHNLAVGFPHGNVNRISAIEDCPSGCYVNWASHYLLVAFGEV